MTLRGITCVVDDTVGPGSGCWGEHSLAFLIETKARRILFDTGGGGVVSLSRICGSNGAGTATLHFA